MTQSPFASPTSPDRPLLPLTTELIKGCLRIERLIGLCEGLGGATPEPNMLKRNVVRNAQATVAIEGNRLSVEQVFALIKGRSVLGSPHEMQEAANAARGRWSVSSVA